MKRLTLLVLSLLTMLAPIALATGVDENGGVIILQANYAYSSPEDGCQTLVVVASNQSARSLEMRLEAEAGDLLVHVVDTQWDMRLRSSGDGNFYGYLVPSGRPVLVITDPNG